MRDRMERFVMLPFSVGCVSQSSVAVGDNNQAKKSHMDTNPSPKGSPQGEDGGDSFAAGKAKPSTSFLSMARTSISAGLQRLIRGFKGLSQLFAVYREGDEEAEMVIGLPTDVKHVAHIGWDGGATGFQAAAATAAAKGWDASGPELLALPSISLRQLELAMAAQADAPLPTGSLRFA